MKRNLFSSESVSPGHPDKIADQISDAILDALLRQDSNARVACEVMVKNSVVVVAGEVRSTGYVNLEETCKQVCAEIGYTSQSVGFDMDHFSVINMLTEQSADIAQGVDAVDHTQQGAGDQGLMFGFATKETPTYMPLAHTLATALMQRQHALMKTRKIPWLQPDAKAQVAVIYENGKVVGIDNVVLSTQHTDTVKHSTIEAVVRDEIIKPVLPPELCHKETTLLINPTGKFVLGGPTADCGLTGRKIIVDTYGGASRHGGGCFSGKDPSKVDRSAAYCARYIAKHIVAAGIAQRCEVQLAYAIGRAEPTSIYIDTFGTSQCEDALLEQAVRTVFPLTPYEIINQLQLLRPIYRQTAAFGHFGRQDLTLPWEQLDRIEPLKIACRL